MTAEHQPADLYVQDVQNMSSYSKDDYKTNSIQHLLKMPLE
jgi:hypothetical protein